MDKRIPPLLLVNSASGSYSEEAVAEVRAALGRGDGASVRTLDCRSDELPGRAGLELDEEIEPVEVPWDQAVDMALDGRIEDAKSMLAILYWDRKRQSSGA